MVFFLMTHRIAERSGHNAPPVFLELIDDCMAEVYRIDGIIGAERGSVIVKHHRLARMMCIILAKLRYESRNLTLVFNIERFEDIKTAKTLIGLSGYNPVYICIVIHADAKRTQSVEVAVGAAVHRLGLKVKADGIKVLEITRVILVVLFHGRIETVARNTYLLAHDTGLERERRKVALHVAKVLLSQKLHVLDR